jgi:hypothetical protein
LALTDPTDQIEYERDVTGWLETLDRDAVLALSYAEASAAWNLITVGGIATDVSVLLIEGEDLEEDGYFILEDYLQGVPTVSGGVREIIEPGKDVFAGGDRWMCLLVRHGYALSPVGNHLYEVTSTRYELPILERWSPEMRSICIEIDGVYADLS